MRALLAVLVGLAIAEESVSNETAPVECDCTEAVTAAQREVSRARMEVSDLERGLTEAQAQLATALEEKRELQNVIAEMAKAEAALEETKTELASRDATLMCVNVSELAAAGADRLSSTRQSAVDAGARLMTSAVAAAQSAREAAGESAVEAGKWSRRVAARVGVATEPAWALAKSKTAQGAKVVADQASVLKTRFKDQLVKSNLTTREKLDEWSARVNDAALAALDVTSKAVAEADRHRVTVTTKLGDVYAAQTPKLVSLADNAKTKAEVVYGYARDASVRNYDKLKMKTPDASVVAEAARTRLVETRDSLAKSVFNGDARLANAAVAFFVAALTFVVAVLVLVFVKIALKLALAAAAASTVVAVKLSVRTTVTAARLALVKTPLFVACTATPWTLKAVLNIVVFLLLAPFRLIVLPVTGPLALLRKKKDTPPYPITTNTRPAPAPAPTHTHHHKKHHHKKKH